MIHLRSVARKDGFGGTGFPFSVPAIAAFERLELDAEVAFFVGENGSGKSTLLEAIAIAAELPTAGSDEVGLDATLAALAPLAQQLRLAWRLRSRRGFFLRAEDFFGFVKRLRDLQRETGHDVFSIYGGDLDQRSHGESFLALFKTRVVPKSLVLIDEPEAALSPKRQLALLALLKVAVAEGAQFVIATHSPILLAHPGAAIFEFDGATIRRTTYGELEHVTFTREFLAAPERYLRHL